MNSSVGGLLNVLAGLRHLIETAGEQRRSRIALVVLAGLVLAALSLVIGLVWGLWDAARGVNAQCEYVLTGPSAGTGVCRFSDGANYQMHFGG